MPVLAVEGRSGWTSYSGPARGGQEARVQGCDRATRGGWIYDQRCSFTWVRYGRVVEWKERMCYGKWMILAPLPLPLRPDYAGRESPRVLICFSSAKSYLYNTTVHIIQRNDPMTALAAFVQGFPPTAPQWTRLTAGKNGANHQHPALLLLPFCFFEGRPCGTRSPRLDST